MQLIILVILFIILGYMLAGSRKVKNAEDQTKRATSRAWRWIENLFGRQNRDFREWALGPGSEYFSKDWRQWQAGLSPQEAQAFEQDLSTHMSSLGYDLHSLTAGHLKPAQIEIFVEAVTVYSREYRKAQAENKKREKSKTPAQRDVTGETQPSEQPVTERSVAEKQPSRRRSAASQASTGD